MESGSISIYRFHDRWVAENRHRAGETHADACSCKILRPLSCGHADSDEAAAERGGLKPRSIPAQTRVRSRAPASDGNNRALRRFQLAQGRKKLRVEKYRH